MNIVLRLNSAIFVVLCVIGSSGCTAERLRIISTRQAATVSDIYEQQVLDNLAKFVVDPHATPSFAVATTAVSGAKRSENYGLANGAFTERFWSLVSVSGAGSSENSFSLQVVTDPTRLRLMQCAYQRAVGASPDQCDKCCEILAAWKGNQDACMDQCGITCGWVCHSRSWWDVPKCCCEKYSKHCGVYVWVDPEYRNEFSKLVLAVVDYAAGVPAKPSAVPTQEVTYYFDENGNPSTPELASRVVRTVETRENTLGQGLRRNLVRSIESRRRESDELDLLSKESNEKLLEKAKATSSISTNVDSDTTPEKIRTLIKIARDKLNADIQNDEARLREIDSAMERQQLESANSAQGEQVNFGPPTQFNSIYGGGLIELQQRLDAVPFRSQP